VLRPGSPSHRCAQAFAVGDAIASPYTGWSKPASTRVVDSTFDVGLPLRPTALTEALLAGMASSRAPRVGADSSHADHGCSHAMLAEAVGVGLSARSPEEAFEIARAIAGPTVRPADVATLGFCGAVSVIALQQEQWTLQSDGLLRFIPRSSADEELRLATVWVSELGPLPPLMDILKRFGQLGEVSRIALLALVGARAREVGSAVRWALGLGSIPGPVAAIASAWHAANTDTVDEDLVERLDHPVLAPFGAVPT
jgi:hypothetical protein